MDKLREQIAKIICRSKCLAHNDNCQCSTGAADAILALLQPRMLTKDEAICCMGESCVGCSYHHNYPESKCIEVTQSARAKLKLIQEEE